MALWWGLWQPPPRGFMPYPGLLHSEDLPLQQATTDQYLQRRHSNTVLALSLWGLWVLVYTRCVRVLRTSLVGMWFDSKCDFAPPTKASPLPLNVQHFLCVGSYILLSIVVQQWVVILEFSRKIVHVLLLHHLINTFFFFFLLVSSKILLLSSLLTFSSSLQVYA